MASIIKPGAGIFYMKVGQHANEPLDEILERKLQEIKDEGVSFWGYGGSTCHPVNVVQPFARSFEERSGTIYLVMEPMNSAHFAASARANEYSIDGIDWKPTPAGIHVTGSRYAAVISELRREEFELPLAQTRVALGNCMGVAGSDYVKGRVDKACLEITESGAKTGGPLQPAKIGLVGKLAKPYAVFVRNLTT